MDNELSKAPHLFLNAHARYFVSVKCKGYRKSSRHPPQTNSQNTVAAIFVPVNHSGAAAKSTECRRENSRAGYAEECAETWDCGKKNLCMEIEEKCDILMVISVHKVKGLSKKRGVVWTEKSTSR